VTTRLLNIIIKRLLPLWIPVFSPVVGAADIITEIRSGDMHAGVTDGGYLDLGLGLSYTNGYVYGYPDNNLDSQSGGNLYSYVNVNGSYNYRGLFVEVYSESINGLTLGYNFHNGKKWTFDLIGTQAYGYLGKQDSEAWQDLNERNGSLDLGLRASYYHSAYIIQFHVLADVSNNYNSQTASAYIGKNWQRRNWNFHALFGLNYHSSKAANYYLGVEENEASLRFPAYQGKGGIETTAEVGLAYPVSEQWVFRAGYRYRLLPAGITDSPLVTNKGMHLLSSSLSYVF